MKESKMQRNAIVENQRQEKDRESRSACGREGEKHFVSN